MVGRTRYAELTGLAVFGSFDGMMTALGVILGASGASTRLLLEVALCVSVTGALSMGAGAVLEDNSYGLREGLIMGLATLIGTFLPAVPILLLAKPVSFMITAVLALGLAGAIGAVRGGHHRDYLASYGMLFGVAVPVIAIAVAFGSG